MFPVEYVYGEWFRWQATTASTPYFPNHLGFSNPEPNIGTGSRVEGFSIPQFMFAEADVSVALHERKNWQPDSDEMQNFDCSFQNEKNEVVPIFTVEHASDDPRYVHLRFTDEWKEHRPRYKSATFINQTYLLPDPIYTKKITEQNNVALGETWTNEIHGPVRKIHSTGGYEADKTGVFKYPLAWPAQAMEWLVRPRVTGWPSAELVQDIFESGCHLAPVGRGKRQGEPISYMKYHENPEQASRGEKESQDDLEIMDETEWRLSFSVAENKLGQSVSPVQRHVLVLLKMIKKAYIPELISSYLLKNLLFWEIEKQEPSFWSEANSAKCLLFMLDRLQKCLEERCLPHYIIPQSNLIQYEDAAKLAEGAAIISDVRISILPKTISLLKRCESLTYQSDTFMNGMDLDSILLKIQDSSLAEEEVKELSISILVVFVRQSKYVAERMLGHILDDEYKNEEAKKMMQVPLYAYQSLLARTLCKLWFHKPDKNDEEKSKEEEFISFVQEEVQSFTADDEFMALTQAFFAQQKAGKDISLLIPYTSVMEHTKEVHTKRTFSLFQETNKLQDTIWGQVSSEMMNIWRENLKDELEGLTIDEVETERIKMIQKMFSDHDDERPSPT